MVDYSKYTDITYYPRAATEEYRPEFLDDEFHKISHVMDKFAQEYYPSKNASVHTADYIATIFDDVLICSGTLTVTLYDAAGKTVSNVSQNSGRRIVVKNIGTDTVTIDGAGAQTIDGSTTKAISSQYGSLELFSDGSNWHII